MKTKFLMSAVLALTLMLAACAPKATAGTKAVSTPKPPAANPTTAPTKAPTKIVKPSPTTNPTATPQQQPASNSTPVPPVVNDLVVENQAVRSDTVLVNLVVALKPGWVVIFTDENGQPGTMLGYASVPAGTSNDLKVTIDPKKLTDKMIAELHIDAGTIGTFEYPGPDEAVKNAFMTTNVMAVFNRLSAN